MGRFILHIDMDAFFASCEEANNPDLKNKAVVIGSDPKEGKGRGIVSTCNYHARKFGVHSAMPISKAYRLNPKAVFLRGNFSLYREVSYRIMDILRKYSERFQKSSIDEAYLDISDYAADWAEAKIFAFRIKNEISDKEHITCSIGIASNKLVAKIATECNKPDGITVVENNEDFLAPLEIRKLYGVGPKTEKKLQKLGIETIGNLASYNKETLVKRFGVYGIYLSNAARGMGSDFVAQEYRRKSLGHETTFFEDSDSIEKITERIAALADEIHEALIKYSYVYRTISLKVRLSDFSTFTRSYSTPFLTNSRDTLIKAATFLFKEFAGKKIRLIGIRVSNIEEFAYQSTLPEFLYAET